MTRTIRVGRVKDGSVSQTTYNWTPDGTTNFHREVQGKDTGEVHIPTSQLTDAQRANPEGTFRPDYSFIIAVDTDSQPNPIVFGGVISRVQPKWGDGELVLILDGMWRVLDNIPAVSIADRFGNDDIREVWEISGDSYQDYINHLLDTATTETDDGLKFPQCWGPLPWSAGDLKVKIPLTNPPASVWGKIDELRTGPAAIETVIVPEFTSSAQDHVRFVLHTQTKAQPYYNKESDKDLGEINLAAGSKGAIDFDYINDASQRSPSWYFGSSTATKKGDENYTDLKAKIQTAPDNSYYYHRFGGEQFESDLSADELNDQIAARIHDANTDYKTYSYSVFDSTFSYLHHLGKTLTIVDDQRLEGLSEPMRITGITWDFDDPSSVKIDVLPKDLTVFPRVPQHENDFGNSTKHGGGTGSKTPKPIVTKPTPPEFTTEDPLPEGTVGVPYFGSITASGIPTPAITLYGSSLMPAGLTLDANGIISGTPLAAYEAYEITVRATNKTNFDQKTYHITITESGAPVAPGNIVEGTSVLGIPPQFGAYDPTTMKVIHAGDVGGGSEVLMMDASGQLNDVHGIGKPFRPITIKSLSFDSAGNMITANDAKGVLPGSFLDALVTGPNTAVNGPPGELSIGRMSEQLRYSLIVGRDKVYVWFLLAVTLGNNAGGNNQVIYRNAMIAGFIQPNGLIGNWNWCNPPVVQDSRYNQINTAKFWAPTSSIETFGVNEDHILISTPMLMRDTGYSGYYSYVQASSTPAVPLAIVGHMQDALTFSWGVGSQIPWKKYSPTAPPKVSWSKDADYQEYAPTMTTKGADGYIYVVNDEYGTYVNQASKTVSVPGFHVGGNPNGVSVWRTSFRTEVLGEWEQVIQDPFTDQDDTGGLDKGSNANGTYHPIGVTSTALFYLNPSYGVIPPQAGTQYGTAGSLRSVPYGNLGGTPKATAADPLTRLTVDFGVAKSTSHTSGGDSQIKPVGFDNGDPMVYPGPEGITYPGNPGQFRVPTDYWSKNGDIGQPYAYIGDAGPSLLVIRGGKWIMYAAGGWPTAAPDRDSGTWLMRINID